MPDHRTSHWKSDVLRLIRGSGFIFGCRVFGAATALLTQILLARWLGADEFGKYVLAFSWLVMLSVIPAAGYIGAAMRFVGQGLADNDYGYIRGFIRHSQNIVSISSLLVAVAFAGLLFLLPTIPADLKIVLVTAAIGIPFMARIRLDTGIANAFSWFVLSFIPNNVVRPVLFLLGMVVLQWLFGPPAAITAIQVHVLCIAIVALVLALIVRRSTRQALLQEAPTNDSSSWNRAAMSLLGLALFVNYFPELATVYGGFFLASADLAIFSVSFRLALLVMFGLFAVDAFTAPKLAQHFRRDERAQLLTVVRQATALKLLATMVVSLFFLVAGRHVLRLFGEEFVAGYVPLLILLAGQIAQAAIGSAVRLLSISGDHRDALHTSLVTMILWLVIATALVPTYGVIGLATSVALSLAVWSALLRYFVMKRMQIDPLIWPRDLGGKP